MGAKGARSCDERSPDSTAAAAAASRPGRGRRGASAERAGPRGAVVTAWKPTDRERARFVLERRVQGWGDAEILDAVSGVEGEAARKRLGIGEVYTAETLAADLALGLAILADEEPPAAQVRRLEAARLEAVQAQLVATLGQDLRETVWAQDPGSLIDAVLKVHRARVEFHDLAPLAGGE